MKRLGKIAGLTLVLALAALFVFAGCGGSEKFEKYTLKQLVVTTPLGNQTVDLDNMTTEESATYKAVLDLYGKTVEISDKNVKFTGTALSTYSPAAYTKSGTKITWEDKALGAVFNDCSIDGGEFSFGLASMGITYKFVFKK